MHKAPAVVCLAALTLALGGCGLLRSPKSAAYARAAAAARDIPYDGSFEYESARAALREGRYGAAIQSLRRSELYPRYRAQSANDMAIAYAALGRDDVALYFFQKAVDAAPDEAKFQVNLAIHQGRMVRAAWANAARQAAAPAAEPAARASVVRIVSGGNGSYALVADKPTEMNVVRLSDREVRIVDHVMTRTQSRPALAVVSRSDHGLR